jgi:dihydroorotase
MFGWPALGEELEILRDIELARITGCDFHVCHISTARGLEYVRRAKSEGLNVTCEVTPHHLFLCEDDITDSYDTNLKMNPPLRTAEDAAAMREGILDGSIDCVVTDHAPHAAHEKDCEWEIAYFGCVGLETSLPLMLTNLVLPGKMSWQRLVEVMAVNPRRILRLEPVRIEEGSAADLTLIDPAQSVLVTPAYLQSKSKNSAFLNQTLTGCASDVFVDGRRTLANGEVVTA